MTNKQMFELLDDMFDKWTKGVLPESEDYSNMDKILNELRLSSHQYYTENKKGEN